MSEDPQKLRMLIVEDSNIATRLGAIFGGDYHVTIARNGREAMEIANADEHYDICIADVIMPVESPEFTLDDADTTGLRVLERMIETDTVSRFVVLTVRWDVKERLKEIAKGKAHYRFLRKGDGDLSKVKKRIQELMSGAVPGDDSQ